MIGSRSRRAWAAAVLGSILLGAMLGAGSGVAQDDPGLSPAVTTAPMGSMVIVSAASSRDGTPFQATAVGVVVDASGLILAPASVVAPDSPGVAVQYGDPDLPAQVSQITVSLGTPTGAGQARGRSATVVAADGYLDLAILAVTGSGQPLRLTTMPLSRATPATGDPVTWSTLTPGAIATMAETAGTGQTIDDPRIADGPAWLTSDILTGDADPGGALVDADGALLAYPVWAPGHRWMNVSGRPAALVEPLLAAARSGSRYAPPYTVGGTGQESIDFVSWAGTEDPCNVPADERGELLDYPTGTDRITVTFGWDGFSDGEDILEVWYDADPESSDPVLVTTASRWAFGPAGECLSLGIFNGDGSAIADGTYGVRVLAGGRLRTVGDATTTIGREPDGINLKGRIVNADTGKGVKEALVILLVPGTEIQEWLDNPSDRQVAASDTSDKKGYYETAPPITPGEYPFLVYAEGYRIIGGSLDLTTGSYLDDLQLTPAG